MFGDITAGDWLIIFARWVHAIAAVAWVGGSIFFAAVLRPLVAANPDVMRKAMGPIGGAYREVVDIAVVALIISGLVLMFNRMTGDNATVAWAIVFAVKIALALWMFYLVWRLRQSGYQPTAGSGILAKVSWLLGYNALVFFGVIIFLLATVLRELFEKSVTG